MAEDLSKLMVLIEANTKAYENAMKKIQSSTEKAMKGSADSAKVVDLTLKQLETGSGRVGAAIAKMEAELADVATKAVMPMKLTNQQLGQMQFQLQDLGVQLASGQSPFMAILQQGSQIGQMFGPGSTVTGALKATGAGIFAFLTNPINLAIVGFGAAAAIAPKIFEAFSGPEARTAEDTLKTLDGLLDDLEKKYQTAADAARKFIDASRSTDEILIGLQDTRRELEGQLSAAFDKLRLKVLAAQEVMASPEDIGFAQPMSQDLQELINLVERVVSKQISVDRFKQTLEAIRLAENVSADVKALADELLVVAREARNAEAAIRGIGAATAEIDRPTFNVDGRRFSEDDVMGDLAERLRRQADDLKPKKQAKTQGEKQEDVIRREQEAIAEYLDTLRQEYDLIGATTLEREKANAVRRLGMSATDEQIDAVERLIEVTYREQQAFEALQDAQAFFAQSAADSLMSVVDGSKSAGDAMKDLARQIARAALQALLLGQGPLSGIFGTANPNGGVGGIFGSLFGLGKAGGGHVDAGKAYPIGERGPELFIPHSAGKIVPNSGVGKAANNNVVVNVNAPPGSQVEQKRRRMGGGPEIIDVFIKAAGSTYGLNRPATQT